MARYELSDGKSNKFWEIKIEGAVLTVTFGRIGTAGTSSTKVLPSPGMAKMEHDKLVAEKTKKGYKPVAAPAVQTAAAAGGGPSPADLEAQIIACPGDEQAWRAYGEALKAAGDVRGDAVLLSMEKGKGGEPPAELKNIVARHGKKWLGDLGKEESSIQVTWTHGAFIDTARVTASYDDDEGSLAVDAQIRALLRLDAAKFLRELTIGLAGTDGDNDYGPAITALVKAGMRPSLRKLVIGDFEYPDETEISWVTIGDVSRILPLVPNLEELFVQGGKITLPSIAAPCLRSLTLRTGGLPGLTARAVAAAKLPELTHLEIWFGAEEYGATADVASITPLLGGKGFPKLARLGLMNAEFENDIAKAVAGSKILAQLKELDLSMGTMTDEGGEAILAAADGFSHLAKLNLEDNYLSEDMAKKIKKAIPSAQVDKQRKADEWDNKLHYYVSVGE